MPNPQRLLTVQQAVELIENDSDIEDADIAILPPNDNLEASDIEDIDDNVLDEAIPSDVCGEVDIVAHRKVDDESTASDDEILASLVPPPATKSHSKKPTVAQPKWTKILRFNEELEKSRPEKLLDMRGDLLTKSPFELFLEIFDEGYIEHCVGMSNLYAQQKLGSLNTSTEEMIRFFGVLLFSGYHIVPQERYYWSTAEDLSNNIVPKVMSRKRFEEMKQYFHLVDNLHLEERKAAKIAPFYDHLSNQFVSVGGVFTEQLSIDESMVPYYGHHSCKMFIRGKPIRFGYKVWMLCSPDGYPYCMQIYTGAKTPDQAGVDSTIPLGTRVVTDLVSVLETPQNHCLYFDNYFTSYGLMMKLRQEGIRATGTVRENRTQKCPVQPVKELGKSERGAFDYRCDGNVICVRWNDNSVVTLLSNWEGFHPVQQATRYSIKEKKKVSIQQPKMIQSYNNGMGGVDLMDRLLGSYRPQLRSKKWWWNLFANGLNMAVVAAWHLHCHLHEKDAMSQLEFRREIAIAAMKNGLTEVRQRRGGLSAKPIPGTISSNGHFLTVTSQGRCIVCKSNTTKWCEKCAKRLHERCFSQFHS